MERKGISTKVLLRKQEERSDNLLAGIILAIAIFGVVMVADASVVQAETYFGDKLFFVRQQLVSLAVGVIAFFFGWRLPPIFWQKITIPLLILAILLLILVLIPGIGKGALGAHRWLSINGFTFQPAELAKLALVLYLARLFSNKSSLVALIPFFIITILVGGLVLAEPDMGTAVVLAATAFSVLFMSGTPIILFLALVPVLAVIAVIFILTSPYRRERLMTFLGQSDPLNSSYHISQVLLALAGGGLFGVGLGQSRAKYLFLPESATDSIFAVIAEEFGFIGAALILGILAWVTFRMFRIALETRDQFGKLVASGVATWIGIQTVINIAAMTATVPITGIPLPFISHGGTALVTTLCASGIVLGISRTTRILRD